MSTRIKPYKVRGRELEKVREKDPDGRIVVHHRTVDTLGKMLRSGTITHEMHDAAKDFRRPHRRQSGPDTRTADLERAGYRARAGAE